MKIGAVVVTYRTPAQTLQACLASLKQNHINDIEVVNNGRDAAVKSIARQNAAGYQTRPNRGFAAAANTGAANLSTPDGINQRLPSRERIADRSHEAVRIHHAG